MSDLTDSNDPLVADLYARLAVLELLVNHTLAITLASQPPDRRDRLVAALSGVVDQPISAGDIPGDTTGVMASDAALLMMSRVRRQVDEVRKIIENLTQPRQGS